MKIKNENTAIGLLDKMDPFVFRICEDKEQSPIEYKRALVLSIVREWPKMLPAFNKRIQYISDPFYQAYCKASHRLADVIDAEPISESGTFITKSGSKETNTIFYSIQTSGKDETFNVSGIVLFFTKSKDRDKPALAVLVHRGSFGTKVFLSDTATQNKLTPISILADILSLILFLKYCELETKIIKPGKKENHIDCVYLNETKHNVEILDSTWFTTIVRSDGFAVRGHFRLQPFGEGLRDRKLIWIDAFEKHGYTKKAKILSHEPANP